MKKRTIIAAAAVSAIAASLSACGVYGPDPDPSMKSTVAETTTTAAESEEDIEVITKLPPSLQSAADDVEEADGEALVTDSDDGSAAEEKAPAGDFGEDKAGDNDSDSMADEDGIEEIE